MSTTAQPVWTLRETGPIELGIVCIDIDLMIRYYTEVLGLRLMNDAETTPDTSTRFGTTPDGYRIVRLQTELGQKLKLVQPKLPPVFNPLSRWVFERQGIAYMSFAVADLEEVVARLKAHAVRLVGEGVVEVRKGILAVFTLDPEDNYVEFVQYPIS
jgi:catechol 2,3-dioxygenase-like lactoylglutathione lyase family enzyme